MARSVQGGCTTAGCHRDEDGVPGLIFRDTFHYLATAPQLQRNRCSSPSRPTSTWPVRIFLSLPTCQHASLPILVLAEALQQRVGDLEIGPERFHCQRALEARVPGLEHVREPAAADQVAELACGAQESLQLVPPDRVRAGARRTIADVTAGDRGGRRVPTAGRTSPRRAAPWNRTGTCERRSPSARIDAWRGCVRQLPARHDGQHQDYESGANAPRTAA